MLILCNVVCIKVLGLFEFTYLTNKNSGDMRQIGMHSRALTYTHTHTHTEILYHFMNVNRTKYESNSNCINFRFGG
jgi:hypothetical protein